MTLNKRTKLVVGFATCALVAAPVAAFAGGHGDNTRAAKKAIIGGKARNVILLIGDGMGDSEITSARNYQVGADGRLAMDTLPLTGATPPMPCRRTSRPSPTTSPTRRPRAPAGRPATRRTTGRSR